VNNGVPADLWGILPYDRPLRFIGTLRLDDARRLYLDAMHITDANGNQIILERPQKSNSVSSHPVEQIPDVQILPQSAVRLLTQDDVNGLSLQYINYAKNEIYARHGRMFNSPELQNYFNSQSWYTGRIAPENFKESMLSDIEKKNADYLASVEFSIAPKGYQLDAK